MNSSIVQALRPAKRILLLPLYIFVFAVYLLVSYMCAKIRVWSCLVTGNFGLFTEIPVCKFLRDWRAYSPKLFIISIF